MGEVSVLVDGLTHTEGCRWRDGRIWFSDIYTYSVRSAEEDGSDLRTEAEVPGEPSGLGWLPDGRLLVVSMKDRRLVRREHDGRVVTHADLSAHTALPLNDMVVGADGTAWVGSFGFDIMSLAPRRPGRLLRVTPDGSVSAAGEGLHFPNGATIIDGRTLVLAESFGNRLSAFDIRPDGSLSERRDWARFGPVPEAEDPVEAMGELAVAADGISTVDAEGAIWVADFVRSRAVRVRPGGEIVDEVSTGDLSCYSCVLGGADGRTLFLCATPAEFDPEIRANNPESAVLSVRVEVPAA
ncbi:SMP-30/gluconolactonase/LRE family protein [Saccharopolyspora indica]|uniref:SMP-30/gluconolactonase/LRE family protein n=1 Tax=Saccharopolyspora indica TaxID=1229659 RepID=UPI0022EB3DE6|nr:SMP-30/gluconolactonase/LRE family protein [Saccharopolyspora indica]MDA3644256.1 SMP-30/gluconolactonase/LRE family protein [Saccharopolyspora indica]